MSTSAVHVGSQYTDLPVVDISNIKGNAPEGTKRLVWSMFKYLIGSPGWFNNDIGDRIQCTEVNVWTGNSSGSSEKDAARAETVFEVEITQDMCNLFGIMHGGCAAYLIDHCSVTSTVALGSCIGQDGTGLSQSMSIVWNEAAPLGCTLRIVNTSMIIRGRVRTCRSELWNGNKLCVSGVHSLVNAPKKMVRPTSLPGSPATKAPSAAPKQCPVSGGRGGSGIGPTVHNEAPLMFASKL